MKYINEYRIFESSDVCSKCDGSGEDSDYEYGYRECSDCYGTGKLSAQKSKEELDRTINDFKNELKDLCVKFIQEKNLGFIKSEVNQHSDEYDDIESIVLKIQIYGSSTLSKQFLDEIADRYIDYEIEIDPWDKFYLIVTKPF